MTDTLRFFKGDKPAAQFEAGISCGGNYPCVGCVCSSSRFGDFAHASYSEQRTLKSTQKRVLDGIYGNNPGQLKFYEMLSADELRRELEKRGCKDYPTTKVGRRDMLKKLLAGIQRVPSLLMFSPETDLEDLSLDKYCVLPFEPLHDLKGYLGGVLKKLSSLIPASAGALKQKVSTYLDSVFKKAHLYGSDLREALVEVAHLFAKCNSESDDFLSLSTYIECLVQISRILYSTDASRSPKQCLQFYNCAFIVHELHLELFGDTLTGLYFHALLMHGPVQHEVVCSRSVNAEKEERLFKSAGTAAKCTDRKPENMLPGILKRLQVKQASTSAAINPTLELRSKNSRISTHAMGLSAYEGTVVRKAWVQQRPHAWQAHLERIAHFLVEGKGQWWKVFDTGEDIAFQFNDGDSEPKSLLPEKPQLLHFRTSDMSAVVKRADESWEECTRNKVELPTSESMVGLYSEQGSLMATVETEVSHEISTDLCNDPPLCSTPVRSTSCPDSEVPENIQLPSPIVVPCQEPCHENEVDNVMHPDREGDDAADCDTQDSHHGDNDAEDDAADCDTQDNYHGDNDAEAGYINMDLEEQPSTSSSEFKSSVCKGIAKLLGTSSELVEFDKLRYLAKCKGAPTSAESAKLRQLAKHFRTCIRLYKAAIDKSVDGSSTQSPEFVKQKHNLKLCLQLLCNLSKK